jgi:hypothetical protein
MNADPRLYYDLGRTDPEECTCAFRCKQPLSLEAAASEIVFRLIFNVETFRLDLDTTYDRYVYGVRSGVNIPTERLVPFKRFPDELKMRYVEFDDAALGRFHIHCVDNFTSGASQIPLKRRINSAEEFVELVTRYKARFWCSNCSKALFPSPSLIRCGRLLL